MASTFKLNPSVLRVMAFGPEEQRTVCPSCGKKKEVKHKCCPACKNQPGVLNEVSFALNRLLKEESGFDEREMVRVAIYLLFKGACQATLPEVLRRSDRRFSAASASEARAVVKNAQLAIELAPAIKAFAEECNLGFENPARLAELFVRESRNSFFASKAAIHCILLPQMEEKKKMAYREKMFAYALAELEIIGQKEKRLALETTPEEIAESLIEEFAKDKENSGRFAVFCLHLAEKVQRDFRKKHQAEWKSLVDERVEAVREKLFLRLPQRRVA
jgi:hypothetical protein